MTFQQILDKYRKLSFSERDKGDRFERLMQAYLQTDLKYESIFQNVWLWKEFPGKMDFGGKDIGIDLVAKTYEGDYWAIQCKCFQETAIINKPSVDSFLATSSKSFKNEEFQTVNFAHRLWISTTNHWGPNATESLKNQNPPVTRINLYDLQEAAVNWEKLDQGITGELSRSTKKTIRLHQQTALDKAHEYFKTVDRGKLIMACGTGKTYVSLKIAEKETNGEGLILLLVPSIALLGQTLREWSADADEPINAICICSDSEVSKKKTKNEDADYFSVIDLALPASTNVISIINQFRLIRSRRKKGMTVVFSTYQSIDVIANAQKEILKANDGYGVFDLIICDEAHRTTGVALKEEDSSAFIKVHNNDFLQARKRMYMTATPRLYSDDAKGKAKEAEAILCSMDDVNLYGDEIYRIGFGEAVERDLLSDYKVLILTLNEQDVPPLVQIMISDDRYEITSDDATKLIGCINALSKQILGDEGSIKQTDPDPMRKAVAFCPKIVASKQITDAFNGASDNYLNALPAQKKEEMISVSAKHIDGTMSAPERDELLGWLKSNGKDNNECRILSNVRCLSEGVDVPSLDAVMFLSARNSQVDVVQSVGRVMRKSPGKKYGYIIIPVVVPTDVEASKALDDNVRYKVVWTVLNALRAHDDRFNATVNKIELNKKKPDNILPVRPEYSFDEDGNVSIVNEDTVSSNKEFGRQMALQFEQLQSVVFARMVQKVGDRRYWEQWAKDVAQIAERQIERITYLIKNKKDQRQAFDSFLAGLQKNINPSINEDQAVEMLAQHIITKPIFEALFEGYSFEKNNAVSRAMQKMLSALEGKSVAEEDETLQKFYDSVRKRAEGIDNAEGKQRIIIELYDKFFKTAFPRMVAQLGIVYTPVEVVDFIIHSVNDVLQKEFGRSISDENVHVLDPFTGTGTFITRLLQSGLINPGDLKRKYKEELYANEIVLLAYYIAAVNIENAYHDQLEEGSEYESFEGICLTDTFQLAETDDREQLFSEMFPYNSARVQKQKKAPVKVIIGNPPYSIGQKSANDNAQNQPYPKLEGKIARTYANESTAGLSKSLYDAYIKAFRWSTDRLDKNHGGVICFVSNGSWLDGNSQDGFRKVIEREFSSIWVLDLRGNARTQGELRRKEAGNVFGHGSRSPISITLLVKNPNQKREKAEIYYHDIGDYLSRQEKLDIIKRFGTISNKEMSWKQIIPNEQGDWLKQRNEAFDEFIPLAPEKKFDVKSQSFFNTYSNGVVSSRDYWVYNSSKKSLSENMSCMIEFYESQREKHGTNLDNTENEPTQISWSVNLKSDFKKGIKHAFLDNSISKSLYRPFFKQRIYFDRNFIERPGYNDSFFPFTQNQNIVIGITGLGSSKAFSPIISDSAMDFQTLMNGLIFPLYYFEERQKTSPTLFDSEGDTEYICRDGVSDFILNQAQKLYGSRVSKEDIFYYVYGFLHSPDYRTTFANDLKKMLPHLPLIDEPKKFWAFSKTGRDLAELHINYEQVPPYERVTVEGAELLSSLDPKPADTNLYRVVKMRFPKKGQKDTIIYNSRITISNIPEKAYQYVVNGKSAIEWIMERYQVKVDKKSGIKNDPNNWADEVGNPRYILDLLLSIINVSVQTVDIVDSLPKLDFK